MTTTTLKQFTITREIDAPPAAVFGAWIDPDRLSDWFVPDAGWSAPRSKISVDPRPGGRWQITMVDDGGAEYPATFIYREIAPHERLVFATPTPDQAANWPEQDHPDIPEATVTFDDLGGRTRMTFHGYAPDAEADDIEGGWAAMFDRLAEGVR